MRRLFAALAISVLCGTGIAQAASGIIAGAIRWDGWYSITPLSGSINAQNALGPQQYQSRAPSHCTAPSIYAISCVGTQAVMDAEITIAANNGIVFWAFDQYAPASDFSVAWTLYQSSSLKASINWTWIQQMDLMGSTGAYATQMDALVVQMQQSNYQKVTVSTANRPVWFILWNTTYFASKFASSYPNVAAAITYLRAAAITAGLGTPYIVVLTGTAATAATIATNIGADAISTYNTPVSSVVNGTFASLDTQTRADWVTMGATGTPIVANAMTGWDRSPRVARPVPWEISTGQKPYFGFNNVYAQSTNAELVTHLAAAVTYINANPLIVPSKLLLIYAWDENDEGGGSLIPTRGDPTGARLAAIKATIQ